MSDGFTSCSGPAGKESFEPYPKATGRVVGHIIFGRSGPFQLGYLLGRIAKAAQDLLNVLTQRRSGLSATPRHLREMYGYPSMNMPPTNYNY